MSACIYACHFLSLSLPLSVLFPVLILFLFLRWPPLCFLFCFGWVLSLTGFKAWEKKCEQQAVVASRLRKTFGANAVHAALVQTVAETNRYLQDRGPLDLRDVYQRYERIASDLGEEPPPYGEAVVTWLKQALDDALITGAYVVKTDSGDTLVLPPSASRAARTRVSAAASANAADSAASASAAQTATGIEGFGCGMADPDGISPRYFAASPSGISSDLLQSVVHTASALRSAIDALPRRVGNCGNIDVGEAADCVPPVVNLFLRLLATSSAKGQEVSSL